MAQLALRSLVAISDSDKARIRYHLGYPQVTQAFTFSVGGVPAPMELNFMLEGSMNRLAPESEPRLMKLLDRLDNLEQQMDDDQENLAAEKVGNITVNLKEFDMLQSQYLLWRGALAQMFGVLPNPFDQRYGAGAGGINARVMG